MPLSSLQLASHNLHQRIITSPSQLGCFAVFHFFGPHRKTQENPRKNLRQSFLNKNKITNKPKPSPKPHVRRNHQRLGTCLPAGTIEPRWLTLKTHWYVGECWGHWFGATGLKCLARLKESFFQVLTFIAF